MIRLTLMALAAFFVLNAGMRPGRADAEECTNLPPSRLVVQHVDMPKSDERIVPVSKLNLEAQPNSLVSSHSVMLSVRNLVGWVNIKHRKAPQANGMVCDAPELVEMFFGSTNRTTFIADTVAGDACVRREVTAHETVHARVFATVVDQFIAENESAFRASMIALKTMPASSFKEAASHWNKGLQLIMDGSRQALLTKLQTANAGVDSKAVLQALEQSCGGKLKSKAGPPDTSLY
jgi:hypothetical protein